MTLSSPDLAGRLYAHQTYIHESKTLTPNDLCRLNGLTFQVLCGIRYLKSFIDHDIDSCAEKATASADATDEALRQIYTAEKEVTHTEKVAAAHASLSLPLTEPNLVILSEVEMRRHIRISTRDTTSFFCSQDPGADFR